jgi:hypothetical protein
VFTHAHQVTLCLLYICFTMCLKLNWVQMWSLRTWDIQGAYSDIWAIDLGLFCPCTSSPLVWIWAQWFFKKS